MQMAQPREAVNAAFRLLADVRILLQLVVEDTAARRADPPAGVLFGAGGFGFVDHVTDADLFALDDLQNCRIAVTLCHLTPLEIV